MARTSLNSIGYDELVGGLNAMDVSAIGGDDDDDDDEIGYDELVGADNDVADFLGIGASPKMNKRRARAMAALQRGKASININPQKARFLQIGGSATQGGTAGALDITIKVQEPFRPQRLILSAYDANGTVELDRIVIADIKVGTTSQMANNGNLPAAFYSAASTAGMAGFQWDTVQSGCDLVIRFATVPANTTVTAGVGGLVLR